MGKQKKRNSPKEQNKLISKDAQFSLIGLMIFILAIIGLSRQGIIGNIIIYALAYFTGVFHIFILIALAMLGLFLFLKKKMPVISLGLYSCTIIVLFLFLMVYASDGAISVSKAVGEYNTLFNQASPSRFVLRDSSSIASLGGGIIGFIIFGLLASAFTKTGAQIVALLFIIGCLFLVLRPLFIKGYKTFKNWKVKMPEIRIKFRKKKEAMKASENSETATIEKLDITQQFQQATTGSMKFDIFTQPIMVSSASEISPTSIEKAGNRQFSFNVFESSIQKEAANAATITATKTIEEPVQVVPQAKESLFLNTKTPAKAAEKQPSVEKPKPLFYRLPPMNLLKDPARSTNTDQSYAEALNKVALLNSKFSEFKIRAEVENYTIGPSVTRFEIRPDSGVRVNTIANVQDDIMLATAAKSIRIETPIPGKSVVGIEIPNKFRSIVHFKDVLASIPDGPDKLQVVVGKDIDGLPVTIKLNKMPHLLVAGATGSGKSVCMNTIICSLLMRASPKEVRILLVDPKKVEMAIYADIPHLLCPVISDAKEAAIGLKKATEEMDSRYDIFARSGQRNIEGYNNYAEKNNLATLPYIVIVIDELADLMNVASKEVEGYIQRLTQLARAAGIHLIIATQRPSVNIITGVIKANIPSRIAFAVTNGYDSKTILDSTGAEQLLGMGDMLILISGEIGMRRVQGAYIGDEDINEVVRFVKSQSTPVYDERFLKLSEPPPEVVIKQDSDDKDDEVLLEDIRQFVIDQQKASTSLLQRYFNIGYGRAARILDMLESEGIVGSQQGTKPREVLIKKGDNYGNNSSTS